FGIMPNVTFLLDCPVNVGLRRALKRNAESEEVDQDRFEKEKMVFHEAVRNGYLDLAKKNPERFIVVDATEAEDRLEKVIYSHLDARIHLNRKE
ncbi:MAG TPA: dTMP kinase, partial [Desulfobacteria bacterium]|nr:dTMP kinase [Desulfobacteria bacterium]